MKKKGIRSLLMNITKKAFQDLTKVITSKTLQTSVSASPNSLGGKGTQIPLFIMLKQGIMQLQWEVIPKACGSWDCCYPIYMSKGKRVKLCVTTNSLWL